VKIETACSSKTHIRTRTLELPFPKSVVFVLWFRSRKWKKFISDRRGTEDGNSRWHKRYAWIICTL